jgi:hypothetical protein
LLSFTIAFMVLSSTSDFAIRIRVSSIYICNSNYKTQAAKGTTTYFLVS